MKRNIILFIPSIERGGVEKNLFLIADQLKKNFDKIFIITVSKNYKKNFDKKIILISPRSNYWIKKNRVIKSLVSIFLLIKNFYNKEVLILSFQSNILAILISKIFNFKIIIRLNTSLKKYIKNNLFRIIYKFFYSHSDKIIVNSYSFKKEIKKILKLKSVLIYNLHKKSKKKSQIKFFNNFKGLKILNIGRLTNQKDQITLLKCLKILLLNNINFKCFIIGAGKQKKNLKKYIFSNKLRNFVELAGYKKNAEQYIENSDIFVLTSRYEGLPNVLIEAQDKNIPIISSDCPTGPREILLNGKLGDLFKVGNYEMLSRLIIKFSKDKSNLINKSKKAQKYLSRFNLEKNSKKYVDVIKKNL